MLEFDRRSALFAHMNTTTEKHGNKRVPVADLKFEMRIDNGVLAHFHPLLRDSFFKRAEPEEGADLADQAAHASVAHANRSGTADGSRRAPSR